MQLDLLIFDLSLALYDVLWVFSLLKGRVHQKAVFPTVRWVADFFGFSC